jgi:hypothetical protein
VYVSDRGTPAGSPAAAGPDEAPVRWRPSLAHRFRWPLHNRWPRLFPDSAGRRNLLAFHDRERDERENAETAMPPGQEVRVEAVWVAEVFPPSLVGRLYANLAKMGWDADPDRMGRDRLSSQIRDLRQSDGSGWINLSLVLRQGDRRFLGGHRRAALPTGVDRVHASVHAPFSSLSILVVEFILDDVAAMTVDRSLRADYRTEVRPAGVGLSIETPAWRKRTEAAAARSETRRACRVWMREHLYGRFANSGEGMGHPVVELISTTKGIVVGEGRPTQWSLGEVMDVGSTFDSWRTRRGPSMRLRRDRRGSRGDDGVLLLNVNRGHMVAEAKKRGYGMPTAPDMLANGGSALTALWAIPVLLDGYHTELSRARDTLLASAKRTQVTAAVKKLRALDATVLALSGDVRVVTGDLARFTNDRGSFLMREAPELWPMDKRWSGTCPLSEALLEMSKTRTEDLRTREAELRDLLTVDAATKGAIANIKLQRWIIGWTALLTVLTVVLVWLAIATLSARTGGH